MKGGAYYTRNEGLLLTLLFFYEVSLGSRLARATPTEWA
jgi:hypothetical protein